MKVAIISDLPDSAKSRILACFPKTWQVTILSTSFNENALTDTEVIVPEHLCIDEAFLKHAPKLRLIQVGAGYDNIDLAACKARQVAVCHAPGINAQAVAEQVMAYILCWNKKLLFHQQQIHAPAEGYLTPYRSRELSKQTIGLIGLGHIGQAVSRYCQAFNMRILAYSRHQHHLPHITQVSLPELLSQSDIISLHLPLTQETHHLMNQITLTQMQSHALLINTARGGLIDESALIKALENGVIAGACLDVFENEPLSKSHKLRSLDNVILTPHTAGYPDGLKFHQRRYQFFVDNIHRLINDEPLAHQLC